VAIQLYSLRDVAPKDVPGTLRQVAAMGYQGVEFAGYYDLAGDVLRRMLDDCGLRCAGAHTSLDSLEGDVFDKTVAINKTLGTDRLIVAGADLQDLSRTIQRLNAAHARAKTCGMRVGFHNHTHEFDLENGMTKFDRIFTKTPGDFLVQLDIGWATCAGQDVPAILRKYAERIETVHVKEYSRTNEKAAVGEGAVPWSVLFEILEKETAVQWYIVEQEKFAVGPMESIKTCIDNIRKMGR
ncbi:MAG: TIM barrel protein, partial [Kiritimatiellota bacterium]|nr:TIM barrel protein [Kiritimatiellota bacterium]